MSNKVTRWCKPDPSPCFTAIAAVIMVIMILILATAGCTTTQTEVVEVPGPVQYVDIPSALLVPCEVDTTEPETNGELLESWWERERIIKECNGRVEAIKGLE